MNPVSIWPVIVASLAAFGIGSLWYSPFVFGKQWMALSGIKASDMTEESKRGMWKLYAIQFATSVVTFGIIGFFVAAIGGGTAGDGAFLGLLAWIGFPAMAAIGEALWTKKPWKLALITLSCTLISWIVGGAIIGGWR